MRNLRKTSRVLFFLESLAPTTNGTIDREGQPADLERVRTEQEKTNGEDK